MMLIQDNCHTYNPPGNQVRADCDQVFQYYYQDYDKTVDKWHKVSSEICGRNIPFTIRTIQWNYLSYLRYVTKPTLSQSLPLLKRSALPQCQTLGSASPLSGRSQVTSPSTNIPKLPFKSCETKQHFRIHHLRTLQPLGINSVD